MNPYMQSLRRSGRTTRMLIKARELAREGRAVYVIASSPKMAKTYQEMLDQSNSGVKVEYPAPHNFDWETLTLKGAHPNCVVLVDHLVIERRFAVMLDALHAFDEVTSSSQLASFVLATLPEERRHDVISQWCAGCGGPRPCHCQNDE